MCLNRKRLCVAEEGVPPRMVEVYYWGYPDQPPKGTRPYGSYRSSLGSAKNETTK